MRPFMSLPFLLHALSIITTTFASLEVRQPQSCASQYTVCQPRAATASALPPVGTALAPLYTDLLSSVKGVKYLRERSISGYGLLARDVTQICCASGTTCLNLDNFNIPFCYDPFTTNFFLADGSTGTLDKGVLSIVNGPQVNLINGEYSSAATSGNIYGTSSPLNTATLAIPTPYTSSGIGGAIPLSDLAGLITITTTIPGTTIPPQVIAATTAVSPVVIDPSATILTSTTDIVSGHTLLTGASGLIGGTTITTTETEAATTIPATTVPPTTITFTTAVPKSQVTSKGLSGGNSPPMAFIGLLAAAAVGLAA